LKATIFIFVLAALAAGSVVAQENNAWSRPVSATAETVSSITDRANHIFERAIDEHFIERLGLFDRPDDGGSGRYSLSVDLENEDSDWSFEVTVTMEF
jgi:hypothetical protein